jgi:RNA polymerase sigma factor (sigma-70 family)
MDQESMRRLTDWFCVWREPLRRFLVGKSSVPTADLDDVAQEVFLRLLRYDRAELIEHPQAYLYKMAANVAAEWSVRMRYARPHEAKWLADLTANERAGDVAAQSELQGELERALMALTPRQREVVKLLFFESLSRAQIAERLGLSERTVKRILMKSYEELRQILHLELLTGISDGHS